jgi:hypothetical protein
MTKAAQTNFGSEVWMAPAGDPLEMVAELITLNPPPETRDTVDVTTHDSETDANGGVPMEFIGETVYDPGDFTFKINYIMNSDGDLMILAALGDPIPWDMKLVGKSAVGQRQLAGSGIVISYAPDERPIKGVQTATVKVKRSGVWTPGPVT